MSSCLGVFVVKLGLGNSVVRYYLLLLILLIAFFFRFHALDEVPPGLTHDEGAIGFFVRQIANRSGFTIDAPYGYANEPFTMYSASVAMWLVGQSDWALRAHQALWGVMLVLFTYKWAHAAFGWRVGLGGAALVAVSFWPQMTSRFALNSNPAPVLFTAAVWLMWEGLFVKRPMRFREAASQILAWTGFALCLAAALYTYEAARGAWLALLAFALYLALFGPRRRLWQFAIALAAGTMLALPHLLDPVAWGRTSTLAGPITSAVAGDFAPLTKNVLEAAGTLFVRGDPFVVYNIPGRPVLDPVTAALFITGLAWCVWWWRRPEAALSILWFGAGFAPAAAIGAFTMMLHAITAQAVVFVLPALAVDRLANLIHRNVREERRDNTKNLALFQHLGADIVWVSFGLLVAITAAVTCRDYFDVWANARDTRSAYFSNFRAVMDYLRLTSYSGSVSLSSPFPGLPHDPFSVDLRVRRADLDIRWFDAREALVFPKTQASLLVLPANAQPDPIFAGHLPMANVERHIVRATDVDPYFDTVMWNPAATLDSWLADGSLTRLDPPPNFGGAVELVGYRILTPRLRPGETAATITFWRILDPAALGPRHPTNYSPEAQLFLHVLDVDGNFVSGSDRLHAPVWNWHAGDTLAQIHRVSIPVDLSSGDYILEIGIYTLPDLSRLAGPDFDAYRIGSIAVQRP